MATPWGRITLVLSEEDAKVIRTFADRYGITPHAVARAALRIGLADHEALVKDLQALKLLLWPDTDLEATYLHDPW